MHDVTGRTGRFVVRAYIEFVGEGPDEGHLCHMCDVETIGSHETIGSANAHMAALIDQMPDERKSYIRNAIDSYRSEVECQAREPRERTFLRNFRKDMDHIEEDLGLVFHIYEP